MAGCCRQFYSCLCVGLDRSRPHYLAPVCLSHLSQSDSTLPGDGRGAEFVFITVIHFLMRTLRQQETADFFFFPFTAFTIGWSWLMACGTTVASARVWLPPHSISNMFQHKPSLSASEGCEGFNLLARWSSSSHGQSEESDASLHINELICLVYWFIRIPH